MQFINGSLYHIYNRGNNKQRIFFSDANYLFFIEKMRKYICPNCDLINWVLMPNHFHFLIQANSETTKLIKHSPIAINALTEGIRLLLSSYAKAIQKQEGNVGNLFQQKTKSKCVDEYSDIAFHYIHQNAFKAGLAKSLEDWRFSSFNQYVGKSDLALCNLELAYKYLNIDRSKFLTDSYGVTNNDLADQIF